MTIPNMQVAFKKEGIVLFESSTVIKMGFVKENHEWPKSTKGRKNVTNMTLLFSVIVEIVERK